jgi:hypothetical protein
LLKISDAPIGSINVDYYCSKSGQHHLNSVPASMTVC